MSAPFLKSNEMHLQHRKWLTEGNNNAINSSFKVLTASARCGVRPKKYPLQNVIKKLRKEALSKPYRYDFHSSTRHIIFTMIKKSVFIYWNKVFETIVSRFGFVKERCYAVFSLYGYLDLRFSEGYQHGNWRLAKESGQEKLYFFVPLRNKARNWRWGLPSDFWGVSEMNSYWSESLNSIILSLSR